MAEGVFRHLVQEEGLDGRIRVDSAGTSGWHVGELPDLRSVRTAAGRGVTLTGSARQVRTEDLRRFDYVVAMDLSNLEELNRYRTDDGAAGLFLLREFDPAGGPGAEVPDPYYGGPRGFDEVFEMVERSCRGLLDHILEENPEVRVD
jgi:protein-tyrosine phosphatase